MSESWSSIRKKLEQDFLCEKLRGRVQYFFTIYHNAPDQYGRFAVRVDGTEMFHANLYHEGEYDRIASGLKSTHNIPAREWNGKTFLHEEENLEQEEAAALLAIENGIATTWDVMAGIHEFLAQPIQLSLKSSNYIVRMLAILDGRVGKRTLIKLAEYYSYLPQWLKQFYELRFAVEGIQVSSKEHMLLSSDGDVCLYQVSHEIIQEFQALVEAFPHGNEYSYEDFVDYVKKVKGNDSIQFIEVVGCYPEVDAKYKKVFWYNF